MFSFKFRVKLERALRLGLFLFLVLAIAFPSTVVAQSNSTTSGDLLLDPAFENIGVISSFTGDDNGNNQAVLEYREAGSGTWQPGIPMTGDHRAQITYYPGSQHPDVTVTNPWANQWRAVIFGLKADTRYEVRVTYSDPDGVSGTNPVISTVTTRSYDPPSTGNRYYVATDGSDTTGDGTQSNPWETIQHAADQVSAGDRVLVGPGTYHEQVTISNKSGAADNYITFESMEENGAIIDAQASREFNFHIQNSDYIRIKGFHLKNAAQNPVRIEGSIYSFIENNICEDGYQSGDNWARGGIWLRDGSHHAVLIGNTIFRSGVERETMGIFVSSEYSSWQGQGGFVIKGNEIYGSFRDAIGMSGSTQYLWSGLIANSFLYDNYIHDIVDDDGLEIEGTNVNVAVYNNIVRNVRHMALGVSPIAVGPMYIIRNSFYNCQDALVKAGSTSNGYAYFYHNTMYNSGGYNGPSQFGSNSKTNNQVWRNNIVDVGSTALYWRGPAGNPTNSFDYNLWQSGSSSQKFRWGESGGPNNDGKYPTFEGFQQETGQEKNGIYAAPLFVDAGSGGFRLQAGSPAIDRGVLLPGFNDANSPWPYTGAGPDIGAFEYGSGPAVDVTPPYTTGHSPAKGATGVSPATNIIVHVRDDGAGVDQSSLRMTVEGNTVTPVITGGPSDYTLTYNPPSDFTYSQVVNVTVDARDRAATLNTMPRDSYSFTIASGANQAPVLGAVGNKTVAEGQTLQFTISASDPDGDPLTYSASNLPSGASFNAGTRTFSWTPGYTQAGTYSSVRFQVSDGQDTDQEDITITVSNTNRAPSANAGADQQAVTSTTVTLDGSGSSDPDGDAITYLWTQTAGPSISLSSRTVARPTFTPAQTGSYSFSLVVSDGSLSSPADTVMVTVQEPGSFALRVNAGGTVYTDGQGNSWQADRAYTSGSWGFYGPDNTVDRGTGYAISATPNDRIYQTERYGLGGYRFDLPNGTYTVTLHFAETYSGITGLGQRVFDVSVEGQLRLDNLDIYAEAGHSTALTRTISNVNIQDGQLEIAFTPSVENPEINGIQITGSSSSNSAPALNPIGDRSVQEGQLLQFTISANDPDGDPITYSASNLPSGATFDAGTCIFSWTPSPGQAGTYPNIRFRVSDGQLTHSRLITITVTAPTLPGSGGGSTGGGGGGGGTGDGDAGIPGQVRVVDYVDSGGRFTDDLTVKSENGQAAVYIPEGTIGLDSTGNRLDVVSIQEESSYPEPPRDYAIVSPVYEMGPDGATFEAPVQISIKYDPAMLPEMLAEKNLVAATCASFSNEWQVLDTTADPNNDVVRFQTGHFSYFAVLAPQHPASFAVDELSVTPAQVAPGEVVTAALRVTNTGSLTGTYLLELALDGTLVTNEEITLTGGESGFLSLNLNSTARGEHVVRVDGLSATFTVGAPPPPPAYTVDDLAAAPATASIGDAITVYALVRNTGDVSGTFEVAMQSDGEVIQAAQVTLDGGATKWVSFHITADEAGNHTVTVGGLSTSYNVTDSGSSPVGNTGAGLKVSQFDVSPVFDPDTGKLVSARVSYQMNQDLTTAIGQAELWLKVYHEGSLLPEVKLLKLSQLQPDGKTGELGYVPPEGWNLGKYGFVAELCEPGGALIQSTPPEYINVTTEAITKAVSWKTLGVLVAAALIPVAILVGIIIYRRRHLLRVF